VLPEEITVKLTDTTVRTASLPEGRTDVILFDDRLKGFGLRLQGASRRYVIQYRDALGKDRRFNIGSTHEVTAAQARETAAKLLAGCKLGRYPHIEREERRKEAERQLDQANQTFGSVAQLYLERQARELRSSSLKAVVYAITKNWAPFNRVPVDQITRRMIAERLEQITQESGPVAANRARAKLAAFYTWAGRSGLIECGNPVTLTLKNKEEPRQRALKDHELAAIWHHAGDDAYGKVIRILMLTGQRRQEIGGLRWDELHFERGQAMLALPDDRSKNGEPNVVPLVPEVVTIIESMPRAGDHVFGGAKSGFDNFSRAKVALDARIADALGAPIAGWHLHDLRRTMLTRMTENLRVRGEVAHAILNHKKRGMEATYNVAVYPEERREALEKWAAYVKAIVIGDDRKVLPMRSKGISA
jgi:integrase